MSPQTTAPTVGCICASCDPSICSGISELLDEETVFDYNASDPYVMPGLLHHMMSDRSANALPPDKRQRRAALHACSALKWQPTIEGWLITCKRLHNGPVRWLASANGISLAFNKVSARYVMPCWCKLDVAAPTPPFPLERC